MDSKIIKDKDKMSLNLNMVTTISKPINIKYLPKITIILLLKVVITLSLEAAILEISRKKSCLSKIRKKI
jgi:hypothetical protein